MKAARKLIPAIALLLVAVVLMSSASFAWFTMSREVTATGMNVNVIAPNNLVISDAVDGAYSDTAEITLTTKNYVEPASTVNATTFYTLDTSVDSATGTRLPSSNYSEVDVAANTALAGTQAAPKAFVDFVYYIKTEGTTDVNVRIDDVTVTSQNTPALDEAEKAVRFAILEGAVGTELVANTTIASDVNATKFIGLPTGAEYATTIATANYALKAAGVPGSQATDLNAGTLATTPINKADFIDVVPQLAWGSADPADDTVMFKVTAPTATAQNISVIIVRVWLEGEDLSCTVNDAASLDFDITIKFAAVD